jgi:hypothetical protein
MLWDEPSDGMPERAGLDDVDESDRDLDPLSDDAAATLQSHDESLISNGSEGGVATDSTETETETPFPVHRPQPERDASEPGAWCADEVAPARSHSMSQSSSDLSQELATISDRFSDLGESLLAAARQLHAPGVLPSDDLLGAIAACRSDFLALRDRSCALAGSLHVSHAPPDHLASLHDLTSLLDDLAEAEVHQNKSEEVRKRALWVLDRVLSLTHASVPDFGALRDCHEKAGALRHSIETGGWKSLPAESEHLAEGEHPFAHLLSLIEDRDELSDELWASMHESVGAAFGKPLAAAAARAKLVLPRHHDDGADHHGERVFSGPHGSAFAGHGMIR